MRPFLTPPPSTPAPGADARNHAIRSILWSDRGRTLLLLPLCFCLLGCPDDSSPAAAPKKDNTGLYLEENISPTIYQTGDLSLVFASVGLGLRTVPWREVHADGTVNNGVRLSLGLIPLQSGGFADLILENADFAERSFFQLTQSDLLHLRKFLVQLGETKFYKAPDLVNYRVIHAHWGDLKFRLYPNGAREIYVFTNSNDDEIWSPIDLERFLQVIELAIEQSRKLENLDPSARLR